MSSFLNRLADPYGMINNLGPVYGRPEEEEEKKPEPIQRPTERMREETGMPNRAQGAGFGQSFLVSLLQSAPAMARVMSANSTDDIQRALSDHAEAMQRYAENRQLQQERATERDFTLQRDEAQVAAQARENAANRENALDLAQLRESGEDTRLDKRLTTEERIRVEERKLDRLETNEERANAFGASLAQAGFDNPEMMGAYLTQIRATGDVPAEAWKSLSGALSTQAAVERAHETALSSNRKLTPAEERLERAQGMVQAGLAVLRDQDPLDPNRIRSLPQALDSIFGSGAGEFALSTFSGDAFTPTPETPLSLQIQRGLQSAPDSVEYREIRRDLNTMPAGQFKQMIEMIRAEAPDAAAIESLIESALNADSENRKELERLRRTKTPVDTQDILRRLSLTGI